jgi:hypothetical protein
MIIENCCTCNVEFEVKPESLITIGDAAHLICAACQREFTQDFLNLIMTDGYHETALLHHQKSQNASSN